MRAFKKCFLIIFRKDGVTLLEVIVAMFIGVIIAATAGFLLLYNINNFTDLNNEVKIQSELSQILEQITIAAKESSEITKESLVDLEGGALTHKIKYTLNNENMTEAVYDAAYKTLEIKDVNRAYLYESIEEFTITIDANNSKLAEISVTGERGNVRRTFSTQVTFRNPTKGGG